MNNIIKHNYKVTKEHRNESNNQKSTVIWLTGLSGSGKSTIANELENKLFKLGYRTYVLDGDNIRSGLNKDLGFSDSHRKENIRRISEVAKLMADAGMITITAFISPFEEERNKAKEILNYNLVEVFVKTSLDICIQRDTKGLYKKALSGEIKNFTGIDSPYEEPKNPNVVVEAGECSIEECVNTIYEYLLNNSFINKTISTLDKTKTIALDFDGVIHKYSSGFKGLDNVYDIPMEGCEEALAKLKESGFILKIMSSRPKNVIIDWLKTYNLDKYIDGVSNQKIVATIYIDDRGYHFENWSKTLEEINNHPKFKRR